MSPQSPSLSEVIRLGIQRELANLHTALPGMVEAYDPETRLARVKPLLRRLYAGEDQAVDLPVISNVPVLHPRTANAQVSLPISAGDCVLLIFCERSIDRWLEIGGTVDPEDPAMHALNDAVAIPGLFPKGRPLVLNGEQTSVEISNGLSCVEIARDGEISIRAAGMPAAGVVTGACICAFTGSPHPDSSLTVKASR